MATKKEGMETEQEQKRSGAPVLWIIISALLLLGNGVLLFLYLDKSKTADDQQTEIVKKNDEMSVMKASLDSMIADLEAKKQQLAQLEGDTAALAQQIIEFKQKVRTLNSYAGYKSKYNELRKEFETYRMDSDKQIADLKYKLAQADTVIQGKNVEINTKNREISDLNVKKDELQKKVDIASVLKAENFKVQALNSKNKMKEGEDIKAKSISTLKVVFELAKNEVADVREREIYLLVKGPDGATIYDEAKGGGQFTLNGQSQYYTQMQSLVYDRSAKTLSWSVTKGADWAIGNYTIEVYCENKMIGQSKFTAKK